MKGLTQLLSGAIAMTDYQTLLIEYMPRPITSAKEHRRALKYMEANMEPHPPKAKALLMDLIATLIAVRDLVFSEQDS